MFNGVMSSPQLAVVTRPISAAAVQEPRCLMAFGDGAK